MTFNKIKLGFTLAEALMALLITSILLAATMPVITKKTYEKPDYRHSTTEGFICNTEEESSCTFTAPSKAYNFAFYYNDEKIPSFFTSKIRTISIYNTEKNANFCAKARKLPESIKDYNSKNLTLNGNYCTDKTLIRIVW